MPGRSLNLGAYRFGFQNQETDPEIYGTDNAVSYKYRVEDARLGRFLSIDPLAAKYPFYSPYAFSGNKVIAFKELEGLEEIEATIGSGSGDKIPSPGQAKVPKSNPGGAWKGLRGLGAGLVLEAMTNDGSGNWEAHQNRYLKAGVSKLPTGIEGHIARRIEQIDEDKGFEYFYRAMSLEEFGNYGGLLRQRQKDGRWFKEGPYVTQNLAYLLGPHSWIFDENQDYDLIVRYKFYNGKASYLSIKSIDSRISNSQNIARQNNLVIKKEEKILGRIPNTNFGFPGTTADSHFNNNILEVLVIPLNLPTLRDSFLK